MKNFVLYLRLLFVEPIVLLVGLFVEILQWIAIFTYCCDAPDVPWRIRFYRRYSWFNERIQDLRMRLLGLIKKGNGDVPHSPITLQMHFADSDVVSQFLVKHILDRLEMEESIARTFDERTRFFVYRVV